MSDERWRLAGETVRDRRLSFHLTIEDASERAGISTAVWDVVEHARRTKFSPKTIRGIATALGWAPDWLDRVLSGEKPIDQDTEFIRHGRATATQPTKASVDMVVTRSQRDAFSLDDRLARLPARERALAQAQVSALLDVLEAQVRESSP